MNSFFCTFTKSHTTLQKYKSEMHSNRHETLIIVFNELKKCWNSHPVIFENTFHTLTWGAPRLTGIRYSKTARWCLILLNNGWLSELTTWSWRHRLVRNAKLRQPLVTCGSYLMLTKLKQLESSKCSRQLGLYAKRAKFWSAEIV